jgi:hypothetical protein
MDLLNPKCQNLLSHQVRVAQASNPAKIHLSGNMEAVKKSLIFCCIVSTREHEPQNITEFITSRGR